MDIISKFEFSKEVEAAISKAIDEAVEIGRNAGYIQGLKDGEKAGLAKAHHAIDDYLDATKNMY